MTYRATCFGGLFVQDEEARLISVSGRRADALLARLIWDQGRPVPRGHLTALLWPEREGTQGTALRQAIHVLRAALGKQAVVTTQNHVLLPKDALETDLSRLRDPATAGAEAEALSETILGGGFLAGLREVGPEHGTWLADVRARADALAGAALLESAQTHLATQLVRKAGQLSQAALALLPRSDLALRMTTQALIANGDASAAKRTLQQFEGRNGPLAPQIQHLAEEDATTGNAQSTQAVIVLGLVLPEGAQNRSRELERSLEQAGAEEIRNRHGTVTALLGRDGLRRSLLCATLDLVEHIARTAPQPAIGLCLARMRMQEGQSHVLEVDRARALTCAYETGSGAVGLDPDLDRLMRATHHPRPYAARSDFVGRHVEQAQIDLLWQFVNASGCGRLLVVSGQPGIGKSRLMEEATRQIAAGRRHIVPSTIGISGKGDVVARLLISLCDEISARANRSPREAVHDMLATREDPVLIVIEDAETLTPPEADALVWLMTRLQNRAVLWMILLRSERPGQHAMLAEAAAALPMTEIHLVALQPSEADRLASAFDVADTDRQACIEQAGGNPLFLNQLLHHVADGSHTACPATVEEAVTARLSQLDAQALAVLRVLAVLDGAQCAHLVRQLTATGHAVLSNLTRRRILRQTDDKLVIEHGVVRTAILTMTPEAEQRAIHLRAARWYDGQDLERHAWHLLGAGDSAAPEVLLQASQAARLDGRVAQAAEMAVAGQSATSHKRLKAALAVAEGAARTGEGRLRMAEAAFERALSLTLDKPTRADALIGQTNLHRLRDEPQLGAACLAKADPLTETPEQRARLLIAKGRLSYVSGAWQDSIEPYKEARRLAQLADAPALETEALGGLADAEYAVADMGRAEKHVRAAIAAARRAGRAVDTPAQNALLAHVMIYRGQLEEGALLAQETVTEARAVSDWRAEINAQLAIASSSFCQNNLGVTAAAADRVVALAERAGAERFVFVAGLYQTRVAIARHQTDHARSMIERLAQHQDMRTGPIHAAQFLLLSALTAERADDLSNRLSEAEAYLTQSAAAHNALRVLPVAALLWRHLSRRNRMMASLERLNILAPPADMSWAQIMHDTIASFDQTGQTGELDRARRRGCHRLGDALRHPNPRYGDMLVC